MNSSPASVTNSPEPIAAPRLVRVRTAARRHWLGLEGTAEQAEGAAKIRAQYYATSQEFHRAALRLYRALSGPEKSATAPAASLIGNPNVQLYLAYSLLWDAFRQVYTAAAHTAFALGEAERAPEEDEASRAARVLGAPYLRDEDYAGIGLLLNGEMAPGAIDRLLSRSSRELHEIYGVQEFGTLTNLSAFLDGLLAENGEEPTTPQPENATAAAWVVRALDDAGAALDLDQAQLPQKYRSAILNQCRQIRLNLNFVGKSDDSLDDALLMLRAFSLLEPVVQLLLRPEQKSAIFAL